jgi:hypothetical protein
MLIAFKGDEPVSAATLAAAPATVLASRAPTASGR